VHEQVTSARLCSLCASDNIGNFNSAIAIHYPGIENIDVPSVFVFSRLVICQACGVGRFTLSRDELAALKNCAPKRHD
jgi:hypothetical protein